MVVKIKERNKTAGRFDDVYDLEEMHKHDHDRSSGKRSVSDKAYILNNFFPKIERSNILIYVIELKMLVLLKYMLFLRSCAGDISHLSLWCFTTVTGALIIGKVKKSMKY